MGARLLTLVRHGRAADGAPGQKDWDRPLSPQGRLEAARAAQALAARDAIPDLFLSSPAPRALETARIVAEALGRADCVVEQPRLYLAVPGVIADVLREHADAGAHVAVVGHNPGLSEFARWASGNPTLPDLGTAGTITLDWPSLDRDP